MAKRTAAKCNEKPGLTWWYRRYQSRYPRRGIRRVCRAIGLRQIYPAAYDCRVQKLLPAGTCLIGDTRMNEHPTGRTRRWDGIPALMALYPHLSVAENMSFGLKLAGAKKI